MKFGLFYELQLPTPWQDGDVNRMFRETLEHVVLAENLGFDVIWGTEHHFLEDHSLSSAPGTWLAAAAALTTRIRIGHGIACTPPGFVHPARLAEHVATLDQISNGRVEFGTGESASRMELEAFGVDPASKRRAWEESVREIANLLAMNPYPGFDGAFFSMPCRNLVPKPFQQPHPPLWVAGKPDVAARNGMGCLGFNALGGETATTAVQQYYALLASECVPIGHSVNPNIAVLANMYVHPDGELARRRGSNLQFFAYSVGQYYVNGQVRPGRSAGWDEFEKVRHTIPQIDADKPTSAIGTIDEVRRHVRALEEAGVDQVLLLHQGGRMEHAWNCKSLELFAREIMPEFHDREARREAEKAARMAPIVEQALARKQWREELRDEDIPVITPYGMANFVPTREDGVGEIGVSAETRGALGIA